MRVLVAYDGSESADQAIDLVAGVAWPPASEVRIVTAHQLILPGEIVDAGSVEEIIEAEQGEAERDSKLRFVTDPAIRAEIEQLQPFGRRPQEPEGRRRDRHQTSRASWSP